MSLKPLIIFVFAFISALCVPAQLDAFSLKENLRSVFGEISDNFNHHELGNLPEGLQIIVGDGYRGFKIEHGLYEIEVDAWQGAEGLMNRYKEHERKGRPIIAAVNGTFYGSRGPLGQVVSNGSLPTNIKQIPARLSRCFISAFRGEQNIQYWFLGETTISGNDLLRPVFTEKAWFNISGTVFGTIEHLLGGGGWILRNRQDVHREASQRQALRFRREDQKSRQTVIAQDSDRNLYFLVFELGSNLHHIARTFVHQPEFEDVQDAIFLDGGSSSTIIVKGKYFVAPLYLIDRAMFTSIMVMIAPTNW